MDMQETAIESITTLLLVATIFIAAVGGIVFGITAYQRSAMRRLANSRRTIKVSPKEDAPGACEHLRSKSRARMDASGSYVSICKKCGVPMKRNDGGGWEATA